jgi:hypothetical protein
MEEILRNATPRFLELYNNPPPLPKPKAKPTVTAEVSPKMAEAVRANPESLRVAAKGADGVVVFEPARPVVRDIPDPLEGDPAAMKRRLLWDRGGVDPELIRAVPRQSGEVVTEVDSEGRPLRAGSGAVHAYDPRAGLRRSEDE